LAYKDNEVNVLAEESENSAHSFCITVNIFDSLRTFIVRMYFVVPQVSERLAAMQ